MEETDKKTGSENGRVCANCGHCKWSMTMQLHYCAVAGIRHEIGIVDLYGNAGKSCEKHTNFARRPEMRVCEPGAVNGA